MVNATADLFTSTGFFVADSHQMPIYLLRALLELFESADNFATSDELVMY